MPATASKPKAQPKQHTFYSRHAGLRLVRVPEAVGPDGWGGQVQRVRFQAAPGSKTSFTKGVGDDVTRCVYEFTNGQLELVDGQDVFPDGPGGELQDAIGWLRQHPELNKRYHESGNEPDRPLPTDEHFMDMVNEAAMDLDVDRIVELLRTERETHNRPNLVAVADAARKRVMARLQDMTAPPSEAA